MTLPPAMPLDADTLSFSLTYGGTLVVALLMFIGQLTTVGILLVVAGIIRLTALPHPGHLAVIRQIWSALSMAVAVITRSPCFCSCGPPVPDRDQGIQALSRYSSRDLSK